VEKKALSFFRRRKGTSLLSLSPERKRSTLYPSKIQPQFSQNEELSPPTERRREEKGEPFILIEK